LLLSMYGGGPVADSGASAATGVAYGGGSCVVRFCILIVPVGGGLVEIV